MRDGIDSSQDRKRNEPRERSSIQDHLLALIPLATCLAVAAVVLAIELL